MKKSFYVMILMFAAMFNNAFAAESTITQMYSGDSDLIVYNFVIQPNESVMTGFISDMDSFDVVSENLYLSGSSSAAVTMDVDAILYYDTKAPLNPYTVTSQANVISFSGATSPASAFATWSAPHFAKFQINNTGTKAVTGSLSFASSKVMSSNVIPVYRMKYDARALLVKKQTFSIAAGGNLTVGPSYIKNEHSLWMYITTSATGLTMSKLTSHVRNGPYVQHSGTTSIAGPGQSVTSTGISLSASRWGKIIINNPTGAAITGEITLAAAP